MIQLIQWERLHARFTRFMKKIALVAVTIAAIPSFAFPTCAAPAAPPTMELFHDQGPLFDSAIEPSATTPVTLTFRTGAGSASRVEIEYGDLGDGSRHSVAMRMEGRDATGRFDLWRGTIPAGPSRKTYHFEIVTDGQTVWYDTTGETPVEQTAHEFTIVPGFHTPDWMKNGVIYQIFPDRFRDGDPGNDVKTGQYSYRGVAVEHHDWGTSVFPSVTGDRSLVFYGGDLAGVRDKLGYIRDTIGADIVYLTPIFQAPSNHKYDTYDYYNVDPAFGLNRTLISLIDALHTPDRGRRGYIVLDGVFNHTGDTMPWFDHFHAVMQGTPGADDSQASPYYSWYTFNHWPDSYASFFNFDSLPKLDYASQEVRKAIYDSPDSVIQHYLRPPFQIDGWRFDCAGMMDEKGNGGYDDFNHMLWREIRERIKAVNPDSVMIGEMWDNPRDWLYSGDQWDSCLNFVGFTRPLSEWLTGKEEHGNAAELTTSEFAAALHDALGNYPMNVAEAQSNHLGNHDTPRFAERAAGDLTKTREALILQMTYIGTPTIYYGDEYGMRGGSDPDCRRTFDWANGTLSNPLVALTHKLVAIRRRYPALRTGSVITLVADDSKRVFSFGRMDASNRIAIAINDSATGEIVSLPVYELSATDGSRMTDELSGRKLEVVNGAVTVTIPSHDGVILAQ
jgi:alpha-glucosidase